MVFFPITVNPHMPIFYDIQNRLYINSTCKMYTFNPNVNWLNFLRVLKNESLNICFEMLSLTKKKAQKKEKKNVFFGTEVNFFCASILGCQLKKHQLNPLWNGITVWVWFYRVMFESGTWERRWSCFSNHNNNHILGSTDTTFLWNCYSKCSDE